MYRPFIYYNYTSIDDIRSSNEYKQKELEIVFAVSTIYVVIPLLYTFYITRNPEVMFTFWRIMHSGVFDAIHSVKLFLANKMISMMRLFGYYTFSTYTVVKNGREVFSSYSEYIDMKTTRDNIKRVDMAKYRVCKWVDAECVKYRLRNDGREPDISEANNEIYDFITHSIVDYKHTRIHRGDFRISTHTQLSENYRIFCKLFQINRFAELIVTLPSSTNSVTTESKENGQESKCEEIIPIYFHNFYLEKNVLLDKPFLQWYITNKLCREKLADYINDSESEYKIKLYNRDFDKYAPSKGIISVAIDNADISHNTESDHFLTVTNDQSILVGSRYIVKIDNVLKRPVFEVGLRNVYSVDEAPNDYYYNSDQSFTDDDNDDASADNKSDPDPDLVSGSGSGSDTDDHAESGEDDNGKNSDNDNNITSEFELIDESM